MNFPFSWLPAELRSDLYRVWIDDVEAPVMRADGADFVDADLPPGQRVRVVVQLAAGATAHAAAFLLRPRRLTAPLRREGDRLHFELDGPGRRLLEADGAPLRSLAFFLEPTADAPASPPPPIADGRLRRFPAGAVHEAGLIGVGPGDVLWLERGALVRGCIEAEGADIVIGGGGVLDVASQGWGTLHARAVLARACPRLRLVGLTVIHPKNWMIVLAGSDDVRAGELRLLGAGYTTDGVDVVGSSRVHVHDVFCVGGDDCLVVKALPPRAELGGSTRLGFDRPVEDVLFERCTVGSHLGGSALEIGHELATPHIRRITYRDIDVMFVHEHGAVFSIHNADHAEVGEVLYERVRVEHCFDKFIDLRVVRSRWGSGSGPGRVRGVVFDQIDWWTRSYNAGHTISLLGGATPDHRVENVSFGSVRVDGHELPDLEPLEIHLRHADAPRRLDLVEVR